MEVKEEARSMEGRRGGTRRRMRRKEDAESMEKDEDEKEVVN